MDILNVLVGITGIFWVVTGIRTHSSWIQSIFLNERKKIRQQKNIISEFGYGSLNTRNKLEAKKGLVFAYWDKPVGKQKIEGPNEQMGKPNYFSAGITKPDHQHIYSIINSSEQRSFLNTRADLIAPKL